jgi:hypothetical protein
LGYYITAKDQKWFRHQGIDVRGPEKRDDPFRTHMRRFYVYDPAPTLRASKAPLFAIFGELDTPEGVKANVRAIRQILDQSARRDYTVRVYPNGSHKLMEVPLTIPKSMSASNDSHRVSSKRWSTGRQHSFVGVNQQSVRPRSVWLQVIESMDQ